MTISPLRDGETLRQQKNLTTTQKRANTETKEGVLVNNFIKPDSSINLEDTCDTLVISKNTKMPQKLYEYNNSPEKSIVPISAIATGVMGAIALLSAFVRRNTKINLKISNEKRLPATTRNVAINEETHQALYQMIQSPTRKTILAGVGVLTLSAMAFMGKTFFDGFKDVWVKKREADIQKNMQEQLIDIETQSFAGKIQITRSMLSEKAQEFSKYLSDDREKILPNFGKHMNFTGTNFPTTDKNKKNNTLNYFLLGAGTVAAIVGLGYISLKNLSKSKRLLENYVENKKDLIKNIVNNSTSKTKDNDKKLLEAYFQSIDANEDTINSYLKNLNWDKNEVNEFAQKLIKKAKTSTTKVNETIGGDGTPKPTFYSHVDDYRAFFYNWLLDTDNKQFKQLFFGITGITAISYGGKLTGDAIKEVQVKKLNAQTEVDLQNRLVSTELRNFKSKKEAAIQPLVNEFYKQARNNKPKEELKVIADNILFEIKNGPPFVYS